MFSDWSSHQKERSILIGWSLNRLSHTPASAPWQSEVRNKKRQEATECWENMGVGELSAARELSHEGTSTRTDYSLGWHSKGRVCQYVLGLPHLHFPQFCYGCDIPGLAFLVTPFNWMICYFPEDDLLFLHPVSHYAVFTHTCYSALTTDKHTIR